MALDGAWADVAKGGDLLSRVGFGHELDDL